ncbi:MAG: T9SS type A sorting domain-containing protein [bacterium]|nr:T9SS type A sorting domain-containing protein [bacterium]
MKYILSCVLILSLAGSTAAFGGTTTVTNVTDKTFTVSWTTAALEKGWIEYGTNASCLNMKAYDERGQETVDDTHYVPIASLSGTTTYYYQAISNGVRGSISTITTAPMLSPQSGMIAFGKVYFQETAILAEGSIVYARLKTTSGTKYNTLSTIVGKNSPWTISLADFRSIDGYSSFQYSLGDSLIIEIDAAGDGMAAGTITIDDITKNPIDTGTLSLTGDNAAPPDISTPRVVPGNGRVQIGLTMPVQSAGITGMIILRSEVNYPQATLTARQTYTINATVTDSVVVCVSTNTTTWTDEILTNGVTYYYRIFTYDGVHNYSQGISYRATPVKDLDNASVYPNPLIGDGVVCFNKLLANTHICIYNIAGELVLEADAPDGTYQWTPKDWGIASGIYLYLLKGDGGRVRTGKIGIVKK